MISPDRFIKKFGASTVSSAIDKLKIDLCKSSLAEMVLQCWHLVEPSNPISWNWHLDEFCKVLEAVYRGEIKRLIVNVPPGSAKSLFFSVFFNSFVWANDPSKRFFTSSYSPDNTIRDNLRLRDIVTSEWYRKSFGVELSSDQWAKIRFNTTAKGWRIASSVGGVGTGEHPDFIILDDLLKAQDARSEAKRKEANEYLSSTISTRLALDPAIILVMQRLHEEDATGFLLQTGGWEHICFPMRYESRKVDEKDPRNIPDPRDRRVLEGQLLWPEKWPEEKVEQEELILGIGASGQLQQRPVPEGGLLYQRDWFEFVDAAPVEAERCRGWDIAESEDSGHWTVGTRIAKDKNGILYVEDNVRIRKTLVDSFIKNTAIVDGKKCKIREGSGSGKATIKARATLLAGYDYAASPEVDDKISRNNPFRAQAQAGNVKIVKGEWNEVWLSVICSFPAGKVDDDVDSTSNAANELLGNGEKPKKQLVSLQGFYHH